MRGSGFLASVRAGFQLIAVEAFPVPVRAEPVEAFPFLDSIVEERREGFDRLSPNGETLRETRA